MIYDIYDEIMDVSEYFCEEHSGTHTFNGTIPNKTHGTTIKGLCERIGVDRKNLYGMRNGRHPRLSVDNLKIFNMMGYEVHLIPVDKVEEVIKVCYE